MVLNILYFLLLLLARSVGTQSVAPWWDSWDSSYDPPQTPRWVSCLATRESQKHRTTTKPLYFSSYLTPLFFMHFNHHLMLELHCTPQSPEKKWSIFILESTKRAQEKAIKSTHYMFQKDQSGNKQNPKLIYAEKMKIETETIRVSKRRLMGKGMSGLLKEGRGRFYILRRCIIMLLCSHD